MLLKKMRIPLGLTLGFALLIVWADLIGHAGGFPRDFPNLLLFGNTRVPWLIGLGLCALVLAIAPRWFDRMQKPMTLIMALVACFSTIAFSVAGQQSFAPDWFLAFTGLMVAGAGYAWFACYCCVMLVKTQKLSGAIACMAVALIIKTALVQVSTMQFSVGMQIFTAIVLPLIIGIVVSVCIPPQVVDAPHHGAPIAPFGVRGYRWVLAQAFVAVFALATTRVLTPLGFFGDPLHLFTDAPSVFMGLGIIAVILCILTYFTLMRRVEVRLEVRFLPAFLIIILSFFILVFAPATQSFSPVAYEAFVTAIEAFTHVLYWATLFTAIRLKPQKAFRIAGGFSALYAVVSVIWIVCFFSLGNTNNAVVLLVIFLVVSLLMWLVDRTESSGGTLSKPVSKVQVGEVEKSMGEEHAALDRRREIAERFALSPRETEVFMLLAQGRSRANICGKLVVSDGTVKTHISHIYAKLGVSNKQEMFDLVLDENAGQTP